MTEPERQHDGDEAAEFLRRFVRGELRLSLHFTAWVIFVALVALGIEVGLGYLEAYPSLHFFVVVFDPVAKLALVCDAALFVVFVLVSTALALRHLLLRIGVDPLKIVLWPWKMLRIFWERMT